MRVAYAALGVIALTLGAAACGGAKKPSAAASNASSADAVRAAVKKTTGAGSEHVQLATTVSEGSQGLSLAGAGDFDTRNHVGSLRGKLALAGVQTTLDEVSQGSTIYVRSPFLATFLPSGKSWLTANLQTASSLLGPAAGAALSADPSAALASLASLANVQRVGTTQVEGAQATQYHGSVDASKVAGAAAGAKTVPFDVWVGADGYIQKLELTTSGRSSGRAVKIAVTMTLSDYGKSVHVTVPAASKTVDASKVSIPGLGS